MRITRCAPPALVIGLTALVLIPLSVGAQARQPRVHRLPATPQTVAYGYYWSQAKPVLTIASGDIVEVTTMLTSTPTRLEAAGVPPAEIEPELREIVAQVTGEARGPGGHILTGPIFIEGADSGDVLEVKVLSIDLKIPYAYNGCSGFARDLCDRSDPTATRIIRLDSKRMVGHFAPGIEVPLKPFFGSMGVAPPPARGRVSSAPPDIHAGNLDNKELVAGTTLYIPIHVRGALFEVGDGHAAQGDGEVDQTAIETSLRGRLQLTVRKDMRLEWPLAETPAHWITMGMDTSLVKSTRIAIDEMVKLLMEKKGLARMAAYQLASVAADLRITQLVDGNVGVHMMVEKSLLQPKR
jgi:acetamidase/formamidase